MFWDKLKNITELSPGKLFIAQLLAHISLIPMVLYANTWQWLLSFSLYYIIGLCGITVCYHRLLSHRSWKCSKWLEYTLTFIATFAMVGSSIVWVAIHRDHHKNTDTEKDPHSPKYKGLLRSQWGSMFIKIRHRLSVDLMRDKFHSFQHRYYFLIILLCAIILYLLDPLAVVYALLFPAMLCWNAGSLIFSLSHRGGKPHNDIPLVITSWGEGYHQNHHDAPSKFKFGRFDPGGLLIEKFQKLHTSSSVE